MEKIWKNLVQGLQDYCQQNGFRNVILGLSGGLDSAVVSVLATEALGKDHVFAIMMKTKHTSQLSLDIAAKLQEIHGFHYQETDIQELYEQQVAFFRNKILETPKRVVLENIQSRLRGQILMAYSNQFDDLVLACGNRSEAAMGYCTLYGDTCGGLMPIGNLYKSTIFDLARWLNSRGAEILPPEVISRAPSAELSDGQKDEDTLPPYAVLDGILKLFCDENKSAEEIVAAGYERKMVDSVIRQYQKSAFKRAQMPQSLPI